jgi:hypothetical protein
MSSVVYFIQLQPIGPIKIGFTNGNVALRMKALQQTSPHILKWIGWFPGGRKDELSAHHRLVNSKLRAEWFHPTREVLDFVQEKSPDFSEKKYRDEIFMETERALVRRVLPRWKDATLGARQKILNESGFDNRNLCRWLECLRAPDPVHARKAADCAAELLRALQ